MAKVITLKEMFHPLKGRIRKGVEVELEDKVASMYVKMCAAEYYETKVVREFPSVGSGEMQPSSASPVAQASQQTIASELDSGAPKRRGRPKKASS